MKIRNRTKSPIWHAYRAQRTNAEARGLGWLWTFEDWRAWWLRDDRWANRGKAKHQFVMARNGDTGPYCAENVHLATNDQNRRETRFPWTGKPREKFGPPTLREVRKRAAAKRALVVERYRQTQNLP